ncbi:MAG: diguanylate cyclase [Alphaproteobacteria bacterium]
MDSAKAGLDAKKIARRTLDKIFAMGITSHPVNYTVWFGYYSGHAALQEAIDAIIASGQAFTDDHGARLYQEFCSPEAESAAFHETGQHVEAALGQVISILNSAGEDTSQYGKALAGISGELANGESIEQVKAIVDRLGEHTQTMVARNRRFEEELRESNAEIIQLRQSLEDTRLEAMADGLTGLYNRKFFDKAFSQLARSATDSGTPLSLLMLDIDHFKKFNDTYGHSLGDMVLKQVAHCLKACVKGRDITARFGGEEFVILLPETGVQNAATVAEQVRKSVCGKKITMRSTGKTLGRITLSVGVAQLRPPEDTASLLQRADEAMYQAKKNGRNQVAMEDDGAKPIAATA